MVYVNWQPFLDEYFQTGFDNYWKTNKIPIGIPTLYPEAQNNYYKKMSRFFSETFFDSVLNALIFL